MANNRELNSVIQIDDVNYNVHAVSADIAKKVEKKLTISVKQGDAEAAKLADFDGSTETDVTIDLPTATVDSNLSNTSTNPVQNKVIHTALTTKVDKESGKGLSTNDYTTTDKNKLAGIATGAEVNVQSDWNETNSSSDAFIKNKPTFKTINNELITGSGNITITGGGTGNVNNGTLTIQKNGTNVATFTANSASDVTANITVPTITDSLTSTSTTAALSANQGRLLKEAISGFKNITVSREEPTDGATGDIWFKY